MVILGEVETGKDTKAASGVCDFSVSCPVFWLHRSFHLVKILGAVYLCAFLSVYVLLQ